MGGNPVAHGLPFEVPMKIEIIRKYWPVTATNDADALAEGTIVELPDPETARLVNAGIARLVMDENTKLTPTPILKIPDKG